MLQRRVRLGGNQLKCAWEKMFLFGIGNLSVDAVGGSTFGRYGGDTNENAYVYCNVQ